jgi:hypothetical protein
MVGKRGALAVGGLLLLAGCGFRSRYAEGRDKVVRSALPKKFPGEILEQADRLQVVALDEPGAFPEHLALSSQYSVRAAVEVTSAVERERLIRTLYRAVHDATLIALCFHPHHAIRAWKGGASIEIVVCLSCLQVSVPDGEGNHPDVAIAPWELKEVFDAILEPRGLHFDPTQDYFGRWVQKS